MSSLAPNTNDDCYVAKPNLGSTGICSTEPATPVATRQGAPTLVSATRDSPTAITITITITANAASDGGATTLTYMVQCLSSAQAAATAGACSPNFGSTVVTDAQLSSGYTIPVTTGETYTCLAEKIYDTSTIGPAPKAFEGDLTTSDCFSARL